MFVHQQPYWTLQTLSPIPTNYKLYKTPQFLLRGVFHMLSAAWQVLFYKPKNFWLSKFFVKIVPGDWHVYFKHYHY